jgi:Zn finger protein HypA/HybF involved in hydrogenase expression
VADSEVYATLAGVVLEEKCQHCDGNGWVANEEWAKWYAAGQPAGQEPRDYSQPDTLAPEEYLCPECEGDRVRLTEAGRALAAFIRRIARVR